MTTILWLKAFHVIFMVSWFAGIFYLPRLFVNHAETNSDEVKEQLKGMEKRLLYFITPFAIFTLLLGLALIHQYGHDWFASPPGTQRRFIERDPVNMVPPTICQGVLFLFCF